MNKLKWMVWIINLNFWGVCCYNKNGSRFSVVWGGLNNTLQRDWIICIPFGARNQPHRIEMGEDYENINHQEVR